MEFEFRQELRECLDEGGDFVLCTVVEAAGSSPAKPGQKMIVRADGRIRGTVGGGVNEEAIRREAMTLFASGGSRLMRFAMTGDIHEPNPVCGGQFACYLELMRDRPTLCIFGAGHIGQSLARLARVLRFRVTVVDERPDYATPERLPEADQVLCLPYEEGVARCPIDARSCLVIVTPGHVKDREVLVRALATPAGYIGMIGSARKWQEMKKLLIGQGIASAKLDAVRCPIGINLVGQSPEEIALGILGQIVAHLHGKTIVYAREES